MDSRRTIAMVIAGEMLGRGILAARPAAGPVVIDIPEPIEPPVKRRREPARVPSTGKTYPAGGSARERERRLARIKQGGE